MSIFAPPTPLLVEDDEDVRESLADVLSARGYQTLTAANGNDARTANPHREKRACIIA